MAKKPSLFNTKQLNRLSEFFSNLSLVFAASIITPLFSSVTVQPFYGIIGISLSCMFFFVSIVILK